MSNGRADAPRADAPRADAPRDRTAGSPSDDRDGQVVAFSATVHGRVQGVGFRYSARSEALRLGLCGFVRNLPDGTVRVEAEGRPAAARRMVEWLETGPPGARVSRVEVTWKTAPGGYARFTIEY